MALKARNATHSAALSQMAYSDTPSTLVVCKARPNAAQSPKAQAAEPSKPEPGRARIRAPPGLWPRLGIGFQKPGL